MNLKKYLTRRNIIMLVVVVAVVGFFWVRHNNALKQKATVKVETAVRRDVVSTLTTSGKIVADKMSTLNFPAPGKIGYVNVSSGEAVKQGEYLMGLDTGDLSSAERATYYNYLAADANAKQIEDAVKGHDSDETFVQKNQRVSAQTARDKAYDTWLTAQRALRNSNLIAPFPGIVTNLTANAVGDTVSVTDGVTVIDPDTLYFETEIDESDLGKVNVNQMSEVLLDAYSGSTLSGTLQEIGYVSRLSDTGANVFPARIKISDLSGKTLRVGMKGDARIVLVEVKNVITLPVESVIDGQVTKEDGTKVKVTTGLEDDNYVEITSGLNEGDKVVTQ